VNGVSIAALAMLFNFQPLLDKLLAFGGRVIPLRAINAGQYHPFFFLLHCQGALWQAIRVNRDFSPNTGGCQPRVQSRNPARSTPSGKTQHCSYCLTDFNSYKQTEAVSNLKTNLEPNRHDRDLAKSMRTAHPHAFDFIAAMAIDDRRNSNR